MRRRDILFGATAAGIAAGLNRGEAAPMPFQQEKSKLKITGVRLVQTRPRKRWPDYEPAAGSWSTQGVEVASPMSIYPEYKAMRSLFMPAPGGPKEVYQIWEERYQISRGPEGIYMRPPEAPGFGWDLEVVS